ncbi:unnamed protein product [Somion occarium]|uniref:Uncharacterized protein n=1 Tax=Somion occarium TaxID=3059160 RepID=A0ABP1DP46_9APHY
MSSTTEGVDAITQFLSYPFDKDDAFQQGLTGIIANGAFDCKTDAEKQEVIRRSQIFYFNHTKGYSITWDEVQRRLPSNPSAVPAQTTTTDSQASADEQTARQLSLAELKVLIESGRTDQIPNNRIIPNDLNPRTPSQSTAPARKKPWELNTAATE